MKLNRHIFLRVFLVTTLAAVLLPAVVSAQRFSMRPPVLPNPVPPPIGRSMAYVDAGVKWRNIDKIRFERQSHTVAGLGLTGQVINEATIEFTEKLVMPAIEFGHQYGNFFGLLLGLSGFNLTVTDLAATGGVMSSGDIFTEMLTQRMDITTIELKFAGRSWFPLFDTGCIGVTFGGLFAASPYRIVTRSVAYADGRNVVVLAPGTIIQDVETKAEDTHFNLGMCGGADLEVGNNRFFLRGGLEYDWYFILLHHTGLTKVAYTPSGLTFSLLGGIRF